MLKKIVKVYFNVFCKRVLFYYILFYLIKYYLYLEIRIK